MALVITLIIVAVIVLSLCIWAWLTYNALNRQRLRADAAWNDVTAQLDRRAEIISNLLATVSGYASHEHAVFEALDRARNESLAGDSPLRASQAENQLQGALRSLFAVADAYPQLQASGNFVQLQRELVQTEETIQAARRAYNGSVREHNSSVAKFPSNLLSGVFHFQPRDFFDITESAAISEPPRVQF